MCPSTRYCNFIAAQNITLPVPIAKKFMLDNESVSAFNSINLLLKPVFKYDQIILSVASFEYMVKIAMDIERNQE